MPRLSVVPSEGAPLPSKVRDAELRRTVSDLSGLLVAIVGNAYVLRITVPDSSHRRDARKIEEAGQRAALLVGQLTGLLDPGDDEAAVWPAGTVSLDPRRDVDQGWD